MPMTAETRAEHWMRRGRELNRRRKAELCATYRSLGGLGGMYPVEKWTKEEVANSIIEMEWRRLPEDRKLPDPPRMTPPCDTCGRGENARAHHYGGDHGYLYTHDLAAAWVPESEAEAERLALLAAKESTEGQPPAAEPTEDQAPAAEPTEDQAPAQYRVHLIYTHGTLTIPESFRVTVDATSRDDALRNAVKVLKGDGRQNGWEKLRVLSYASCVLLT